jgi:hypothetical protein
VLSTRRPSPVGTFLVDGSVADAWLYEDGGVVTEPFAPLDPATRREITEEGDRLAALHG